MSASGPPPGPQGPWPEQRAGDQVSGQPWSGDGLAQPPSPGYGYPAPPESGYPPGYVYPPPPGPAYRPAPGYPPAQAPSPPGHRGQSAGGRRSRRPLWFGLGGAAALIVVVAVIAAAVFVHSGSGSSPGTPDGIPPGTPLGTQLQQLLPPAESLPSGWYLIQAAHGSDAFGQPGKLPPRPMDQCSDFNLGFDLGAPGDTFVSSASESADFGDGPGNGFLRADLFAVMPGDADLALKAVNGWVARCSSYSVTSAFDGLTTTIGYTVTAASVPGVGSQSLDVRVTGHPPAGLSNAPVNNNTLLVAVGNDLIAIECVAPATSLISSLAALAAPIVKKLPSASALPTSGPALSPSPTPVASPNLSVSKLNSLLPVSSGLPAQFYQMMQLTPIDFPAPGDVPLVTPPPALSCEQIVNLTDGGTLYSTDVNYREVADVSAMDSNSDDIDVEIDEVTNDALASADLNALKTSADNCQQFTWTGPGNLGDTQTYDTTVTSVPGLGDANVDVRMTAVSAAPTWPVSGPLEILMARVGAAIVLVDYTLTAPGQTPSVTSIAQPIVDKL
jgi:hypothetical protein